MLVPLLTALALAQAPPPRGEAYKGYGYPVDAALPEIVSQPALFEGKVVRTEGRLEALPGPIERIGLAESGTRLLVVPVAELADVFGTKRPKGRVQVQGIIRTLRPKGEGKGEDSDLPPLPPAGPTLPALSITIYTIADAMDKREGPLQLRPGLELEEGATVHVVGQFRGRNLFGDLPKDSQKTPDDFVLVVANQAVWITGKKAKGSGWELDPNDKSDAGRWLAVEGKVENHNGIIYIQAHKLQLTRPPRPAPPPPPAVP